MQRHTIEFPLRPVPQRDSTAGRYGHYRTKKQLEQERAFEACVRDYVKLNNVEMIEGACVVMYDLRFAVPKGDSKALREQKLSGERMRTETPDEVNCTDFLHNRLKGIIIRDDSQIIFGGSLKRFAEQDGVTAYIVPIRKSIFELLYIIPGITRLYFKHLSRLSIDIAKDIVNDIINLKGL